MPFDRVSVNFVNPDGKTCTIAFIFGLRLEGRGLGNIFPLKGSILEEFLRTRSGLIIPLENAEQLEKQFSVLLTNFHGGIRSVLSVPLVSEDKVIGSLLFQSQTPQAYQHKNLQLAVRIAAQIAGAVANSKLFAELKRAEQALKASVEQIKVSLTEKEVLLKEIHHRVKNNLQVISSLLNWQSRYIQDPSALEMFKESQNRVKLIALIHEKLYQSKDLARVNFGEYVESLATHLFRSYQISGKEISLQIDMQGIFLGIDKAIPCGLVINELISNSFKHAFPPPRQGVIALSLKPEAGDQLILVVKDSGVGFPEDLDFRSAESLGMQLVNILTSQMGGTIELDRQKGTEFRITFPA
ncbi:MAG: ATP-binding protein [Deltaproteobacteria bacterium]|nr:ATP-binding protein [Deltaproteobacteria bacterium]